MFQVSALNDLVMDMSSLHISQQAKRGLGKALTSLLSLVVGEQTP